LLVLWVPPELELEPPEPPQPANASAPTARVAKVAIFMA
jgi:hypothetical protein